MIKFVLKMFFLLFQILNYFDYFFTTIFTIECTFKGGGQNNLFDFLRELSFCKCSVLSPNKKC